LRAPVLRGLRVGRTPDSWPGCSVHSAGMSNTLKRVVMILLLCVVAYIVIAAIVSFLVKIVVVVLIGGVVLFLLSVGSRGDADPG
jgi:Flp pilus assembly protein TadB